MTLLMMRIYSVSNGKGKKARKNIKKSIERDTVIKIIKNWSQVIILPMNESINKHWPGQHANVDVQVKCLTPEIPDLHLQMGSFPDWAYDQHVLKNSWNSGFVRLLHSSSISDLLPEATPVLGYSRQRKKGKGENK